MTVTVAKWKNKIVEIVRTARDVQFSDEKDWILINREIAKPNSLSVVWVKAADTRFEWVRDIHF